MHGGAQRGEDVLIGVLHLVDEDPYAGVIVLGCRGEIGGEIADVCGDVAAVAAAAGGVGLDAC